MRVIALVALLITLAFAGPAQAGPEDGAAQGLGALGLGKLLRAEAVIRQDVHALGERFALDRYSL